MISPGMQSCEHSLNTLRYADRVKELGAENPETKNGDEYGDEEEEDDEENGDEEDDLALLHNSNVSLKLKTIQLNNSPDFNTQFFFAPNRVPNCRKTCTHFMKLFLTCKRWKKKYWTFTNNLRMLLASGQTVTIN